jgi:hypothetical protein
MKEEKRERHRRKVINIVSAFEYALSGCKARRTFENPVWQFSIRWELLHDFKRSRHDSWSPQGWNTGGRTLASELVTSLVLALSPWAKLSRTFLRSV